jgi:hypothetical protein
MGEKSDLSCEIDFENRSIGKSPYVPLCLSITGKRLPKGEIESLPFVKGNLEGFCQSRLMLFCECLESRGSDWHWSGFKRF